MNWELVFSIAKSFAWLTCIIVAVGTFFWAGTYYPNITISTVLVTAFLFIGVSWGVSNYNYKHSDPNTHGPS